MRVSLLARLVLVGADDLPDRPEAGVPVGDEDEVAVPKLVLDVVGGRDQ